MPPKQQIEGQLGFNTDSSGERMFSDQDFKEVTSEIDDFYNNSHKPLLTERERRTKYLKLDVEKYEKSTRFSFINSNNKPNTTQNEFVRLRLVDAATGHYKLEKKAVSYIGNLVSQYPELDTFHISDEDAVDFAEQIKSEEGLIFEAWQSFYDGAKKQIRRKPERDKFIGIVEETIATEDPDMMRNLLAMTYENSVRRYEYFKGRKEELERRGVELLERRPW